MLKRALPLFRVTRLLPFSSAALARLQTAAGVAARSAAARGDRIRAWVPDCRTGGLVYGTAMLLRECFGSPPRPGRLQVFGTDTDEQALAFARAGRYPVGAALGLDPLLRGRYTLDEGETLRMAMSLHASCIFATHQLGQTVALSRMDLIVCHRIFQGVPSARRAPILQALYSALREDGVLFTFDHRQHFPPHLFEPTDEGYFRPRPSRQKVMLSYVQLAAERPTPRSGHGDVHVTSEAAPTGPDAPEAAPRDELGFLAGGGITGALSRSLDWSSTPLGPATGWPESLKTAASILLGSGSPQLIWWGPELTQLHNDACLPLLGERHPGALGRPAAELWAEAWPLLGPRVDDVMRDGQSCRCELPPIRIVRDGHPEEVHLTFSLGPIRGANGQLGGVFCACTDETQRSPGSRSSEHRLVESALRASEEKFRALVNASSYAIYIMSPDWSELRRLEGRGFIPDVERPSSTWLAEFIVESDQAEVLSAVERAVTTRTPFELEHRVRRADGTIGWTLSRAVPLFDASGEVTEWIGAASDITVRKHAEQALRESESRLLHANEAKDEFLATLGHELRTPLAAIMLWASALRSGRVPSSQLGRAVEAIVDSAEAQSRLIDDLLDLSRLTTGKLLLEPAPVDVTDVVRAAVAVVMPSATEKGVAVELEFGADVGVALLDPARLRQVLWNLLSNAIKFTPRGGRVRLLVRKRDGALEVEVSDDGEGIHPDFVPRVFDRFSQADARERSPHGGLGIGLALSRELVELQGGTIAAHSEGRGRGATFRFRLPWIAVEASLDAAEERAPSSPRDGPPLEGVTVLLVEDERNTLEAMQLTLERAGARVFAANSAAMALSLLETADAPGSTSVLVSDLGLLGSSGFVLVEQLAAARRARGRSPMPACAVSAHARQEDRLRALDAGFDMYLAKPIAPEQLIEAVEDLAHVALGWART